MKKLIIAVILLQVALSNFAQPITTIKGNLKNGYSTNSYYNRTELKIWWFDLETLTHKEETLKGQVTNNGDFSFQTPKLVQPYTHCKLKLGDKSVELFVSPGDSLYVSANKPIFNESLTFTGDGAGIINFRREMDRYHKSTPVLKEITDVYESRINLLDKYFAEQKIDSTFFNVEKRNLDYEYYVNIIRSYGSLKRGYTSLSDLHKQATHTFEQKTDNIIAILDCKNEIELRNPHYRNLIRFIPSIINLKTNPVSGLDINYYEYSASNFGINPIEGLDIGKNMDYVELNYHNKIKQYYLSQLIESSLTNAQSPVEKAVLLDYFKSKIDNPVIAQQIKRYHEGLNKGRRYRGHFLQAGILISLWIIGFVVLFFIIKKTLKVTRFKGFCINGAKWLKYTLFTPILFILYITFVEEGHNLLSSIVIAVWLAVSIFVIHTYIIIPKIALRKSAWYYKSVLFLIYSIFLALLYITSNPVIDHAWSISNALAFTLVFIAFSWLNY